MEDEHKYKNLLVPVKHPDDVNRITELASILVDRGRITFLTVIKKGSFFATQKNWRLSSRAIEKHRKQVASRWLRIVPKIRYSDIVWRGILEQAEEEDSDLILLGWGGKITYRSLRQSPVERVFANSDRDVIAFKGRMKSIHDVKRILFPIGYKDYGYSKRSSVVARITKKVGAECVLTHVLQEDETEEEAKEIFQGPKESMLKLGIDCETEIIRNGDVLEALIEESSKYDLIVLGPTREYVFSRYLFGWMTDEIVNNAKCSALVYKEGEKRWKAWIRGAFDGFKNELKGLFR